MKIESKNYWRLFVMNKTELIACCCRKGNVPVQERRGERCFRCDRFHHRVPRPSGEKVQIAGFGTFEVRERGERIGRDPRTSAEIVIPASKAPAFKAGKALKDSVNK
jgi:DNA-binding protein HU-beta